MLRINLDQKARIEAFADEFERKYLDREEGRKHLETYRREKEDVKQKFLEIKTKVDTGKDITDDVLYGLLPYLNTEYNRKQNHRISTWPAITKDVKKWFEKANWQEKKNWPKVARAIFNLINGLLSNKDPKYIEEFTKSGYSKGLQSGIISPILYCLDQDLLIINSKNIRTANFIMQEVIIDNRLENYLQNIKVVKELLKELKIDIFDTYDKFDAFCYWMCDKRLGGYARVLEPIEDYAPEIELRIKNHNDAIGALLIVGRVLGYERYTAHGLEKYNDKRLKEFANLDNVPDDFQGVKGIKHIDVIWYGKYTPPSYLFQVDDRGDMKTALDRLYEARNIRAKLFIVSPIQNQKKLENEFERDPHRANRQMYRFLSFEGLDKLFSSAEIIDKYRKDLLD